jgi:hypothetical protein
MNDVTIIKKITVYLTERACENFDLEQEAIVKALGSQ